MVVVIEQNSDPCAHERRRSRSGCSEFMTFMGIYTVPLHPFLTAENRQEYTCPPWAYVLCFDNIARPGHWSHAWNKSKVLSDGHGSQNPRHETTCELLFSQHAQRNTVCLLKLCFFIIWFGFKDIKMRESVKKTAKRGVVASVQSKNGIQSSILYTYAHTRKHTKKCDQGVSCSLSI